MGALCRLQHAHRGQDIDNLAKASFQSQDDSSLSIPVALTHLIRRSTRTEQLGNDLSMP